MHGSGSDLRWLPRILSGVVGGSLLAGGTALSASYEQLRSAAVETCRSIDPAAYQSGLAFNPEGYRSYFVRSECFQRGAVEFRDESLCAEVRRRSSLLWSSWGYSRAQCSRLVREGIAADEEALAELRERYRQGAVRLRDFRLERNGNGRDFDVVPSFGGEYAHAYVLRLEILQSGAVGGAVLLDSGGYHLDGDSNLRIFLRQEEIRKRFPDLALGRSYPVRATLILDVGNGGQGGHWSDAFIERVFPIRERSQSITREVRF
jgi:hypothetical protein